MSVEKHAVVTVVVSTHSMYCPFWYSTTYCRDSLLFIDGSLGGML